MTDEPDLRDLQEYFAGRLPERLREIQDARDRTRASGWNAEPLKVFHRLVHSLAGAGTTFGFPEVTRTSRVLEKYLKEVQEGAEPSDEETDRLLELLRQAAR
jgi:HPt (histidine-containing phosphotransfer) domain-containing protein